MECYALVVVSIMLYADNLHVVGAGQFYNRNDHVCCGSSVHNNRDGQLGCCGDELYNKTIEICCQDTLHNRGIGMEDVEFPLDGCCGSEAFSTSNKICCEYGDKSSLTYLHPDQDLVCCDDRAIDARTEACIYRNGNMKCGDDPYSPDMKICCQGRLFDRSGYREVSCCGPNSYDVMTETCCYDTYAIDTHATTRSVREETWGGEEVIVETRRRQECCSARPREEMEGAVIEGLSICCAGQRHDLASPRHSCCGNVTYDTTTHSCCAGQVYDPLGCNCCGDTLLPLEGGDKVCCGGRWAMDPSTHVCCPTQKPRPRYSNRDACCENRRSGSRTRLYASSTHKCIDGLVYTKGTHVCGDREYRPARQLCCAGMLNPNRAGEKCCGIHTYNPAYQTCCHGHPQPGAENTHWCRGKDAVPIASSDDDCPDGGAVCGTSCYDTSTMYCCHYAGFAMRLPPPGFTKRCPCGQPAVIYDPDTQMCNDGVVHTKDAPSM